MTPRRIAALLALAAAVGLWYAAEILFRGPPLSPVVRLISLITGLLALVVFVFNLGADTRYYRRFGLLSERQGSTGFGTFGLLLFGALFIFIAIKGLRTGRMATLWPGGPEFVFAQAPVGFVLAFAVYAAAGCALVWLAWKVHRYVRSQYGSGDKT
ncbi:MAG: hypothetical protein QM772_11735 [Ottowia sp.]|uniref:hypothetical protein n=1 Tax=Ottowia sp. TaxID=1898956 RepID=UPI0039E63983